MRHVVVLVLILVALPAFAGALPTDAERLDQGGILKEITIQEPAAANEPSWAHVRVQAVVDAPPQIVWGMLIDLDRWPTWLPMNRKAHFLSPAAAALITPAIAEDQEQVRKIDFEHPSDGTAAAGTGQWKRMAYEEYDLPWPIKNEWVLRTYTYEESEGKDRASWRKVASQTHDDDGFWEVNARPDGKTLLRYYYRVKAKESVPQPVFKAAISLTVNSMIKALRHESARRETQIVRH